MQCDVLRIYEDALTAKIFFKKNNLLYMINSKSFVTLHRNQKTTPNTADPAA